MKANALLYIIIGISVGLLAGGIDDVTAAKSQRKPAAIGLPTGPIGTTTARTAFALKCLTNTTDVIMGTFNKELQKKAGKIDIPVFDEDTNTGSDYNISASTIESVTAGPTENCYIIKYKYTD